jgi:hypothetical protein
MAHDPALGNTAQAAQASVNFTVSAGLTLGLRKVAALA